MDSLGVKTYNLWERLKEKACLPWSTEAKGDIKLSLPLSKRGLRRRSQAFFRGPHRKDRRQKSQTAASEADNA